MIQTQCRTACKWAQIWAWTCTMQTFLNTREHWMKTHTYHPNPPNDTLLLLSILSVWPSQQSLLPLSSGNCVLCWQSSSMGVCIYIYTHTLCILALCLSLSDPGSLSHSLSHPLPLCLPSLLSPCSFSPASPQLLLSNLPLDLSTTFLKHRFTVCQTRAQIWHTERYRYTYFSRVGEEPNEEGPQPLVCFPHKHTCKGLHMHRALSQ